MFLKESVMPWVGSVPQKDPDSLQDGAQELLNVDRCETGRTFVFLTSSPFALVLAAKQRLTRWIFILSLSHRVHRGAVLSHMRRKIDLSLRKTAGSNNCVFLAVIKPADLPFLTLRRPS